MSDRTTNSSDEEPIGRVSSDHRNAVDFVGGGGGGARGLGVDEAVGLLDLAPCEVDFEIG